jgi:anti-sigma B factor antagonist
MRECIISRHDAEGVAVLQLAGSFDAHTFPQLESALQELYDDSVFKVILGCQDLEYISSAGLGALIGFARRAREEKGDLKIAALPEKIFRIVDILGFNNVLEIFDSEAGALREFSKTGG